MTIDPWFYYSAAVLVLIVPVRWLAAAACAAAFHELCHTAVIILLKERIYQVRLRPWGITIDTSLADNGKELLSALAGPMGSFGLLGLCHIWPGISLCAFVQGLFNLIPVYPLDGGRVLLCILKILFPNIAHRIYYFSSGVIVMFLMMQLASLGSLAIGKVPMWMALIFLARLFCEKFLAKVGKTQYNRATIDKEVSL